MPAPDKDEVTARPPATDALNAGPIACDLCGSAPARYVDYSGVTGMLIGHQMWSSEAVACESCSSQMYEAARSKLLKTGWWSIFGLLYTPFLLVGNAITRRRHRTKLEDPATWQSDAAATRPLLRRSMVVTFGALGAVIAALLLINAGVGSTPPTDIPLENLNVRLVGPPEGKVARADLIAGDCFDMAALGTAPAYVTPMACDTEHQYEFIARTTLDDGAYPGFDQVDALAVDFCLRRFKGHVGLAYEASVYEFFYVTPTAAEWSNDRTVECYLAGPDRQPLTEPARGSRR